MIEPVCTHIAVLTMDLHIPESGSLKSKRKVIASLRDRVHAKFNVSFAELASLDEWQRSICGVVMISNDKRHLDSSINAILSFVESVGSFRVVDSQIEFL